MSINPHSETTTPAPDASKQVGGGELIQLLTAFEAAGFGPLSRFVVNMNDGELYLAVILHNPNSWGELLELLDNYDVAHGLPDGYVDRAHTKLSTDLPGAWTANLRTERVSGKTSVSVEIALPTRDLRPLRAALDWAAAENVAGQ